MSSSDLWMRDLITKFLSAAAIIVLFSLWVMSKWSRLQQNCFKSFFLGFEAECEALATPHMKKLLQPLEKLESHDIVLSSLRRIRILEIGVKTGKNIKYYPNGTHFIGVDWNCKLMEYLTESDKSWQFAHILIEKIVIGDGCSLEGIPSECVDAVVTTRSLCSTRSIPKTLREIRRVLVPGGKYFFMEHIPEYEGSSMRWVQAVLTKIKMWPLLIGNCRLDCDPRRFIENSGFREVSWNNVILQGFMSQPHYLLLSRRHILGVAIR